MSRFKLVCETRRGAIPRFLFFFGGFNIYLKVISTFFSPLGYGKSASSALAHQFALLLSLALSAALSLSVWHWLVDFHWENVGVSGIFISYMCQLTLFRADVVASVDDAAFENEILGTNSTLN